MKVRTLAALGLGISLPALLVVPGSGATAAVEPAPILDRPGYVASRYLDQKVSWKPCGEPELRVSCAKITAPRDWWSPAGRDDIQIAVSKVAPAKGTPRRVVFGNPGGPGGAGLGMAPFLAARPALAKDHLAVGFDPRGTGDSSNVTCQGAPGYTMDARDRDAGNLDLIAEATELTHPYCARQSRGLLPYVDTAQTVHDMDLIRHLLGFERIDYVGYSGGTWLGAYYQTFFPGHVGRFVLDSNTDFTRPWVDTFNAQPQAFERRFRQDFAPWAAKYHQQLKLGRTPRQVLRTYEQLRADLKKQPAVEEYLDGSVKISYDQNTLDNIVTGDLYTKRDFYSLAVDLAFLRDLSAAQTTGGPRAAQRKVDALSVDRQRQLVQRATRSTVGLSPIGRPFADDAEHATFTAVTCNDTEWPQGREYGERLSAQLGPQYPLLGWGMNENPCLSWDRPRRTLPTPTGEGLPTTLMVQSVHDPATNVSLALGAHSRYAGSRLITVTGEGDHGVYGGVNKCADRLVDAFLATGRAPADDTTCQGEGLPGPQMPHPDGGGDGAPLHRIAGFTRQVSGYLR
ncbi:TAP domain protein [Kribbella flavida DSM 17836]|uniref:TAP domain protein n=1 Tax=Kribbella flavida (strain DSM 17836 / JCM 10339 / NBRC 14399) TaxID=479435 RepID=D2Q1P1_KRIFD|nr:alpha/beta hydrolase [Kribbella flavida]ADB32030.1 TAP domain protein [Kribbella flavida DSM 17836]